MKIEVKVDSFSLSAEVPDTDKDRDAALSVVENIVGVLRKHGYEDGCVLLERLIREEYEGKPGWTMTPA